MEIPIEKILKGYEIKAPERIIRQQIIDVLDDVLGVELDMESVSYNKGRIYIDADPLLRSQIQIKKEEILNKLSNQLKDKKIRDIS